MVHIIRVVDKIPFDVNQSRAIAIDTADIYALVPKIDTYRSEISTQARRALETEGAISNPLTTYFPELRATLHTG